MDKIDYDEVINRIGYFRNKANLSMRDTSGRLGKQIELKVKTLLDFCDIVDITVQDFFYLGKEYNKDDKYMLDMFNSLSADSKRTIVDLMKKLK